MFRWRRGRPTSIMIPWREGSVKMEYSESHEFS
jgi:hypothetical protein